MSQEAIAQLILQYRYWILIPLSIIEGPIVAFIAGTLASLKYFNLYLLLLIFFLRDVLMDAFYYLLGYYGWKTRVARRILARMQIREEQLEGVRTLWNAHPARTMFIGKLSYGIASTFIVIAGMVRMRLVSFFKYSAIVAVAQFWTLILLGYFFGGAFGGTVAGVLEKIQYVVAGLTIVISVYYLVSWRMRARFLSDSSK